jgi:flagellum-specific ATP synthase
VIPLEIVFRQLQERTMTGKNLIGLETEIARLRRVCDIGRVSAIQSQLLGIAGLSRVAKLGDRVEIACRDALVLGGEVLRLDGDLANVMPDFPPERVHIGDRARIADSALIQPSDRWIGRIVDPFGQPLDGRPLPRGATGFALRADPPSAASRRGFGPRLETGLAAFNTLLPIVRGQRIGLFAGSGVGKSTLLATLGRNTQADVVVFALIGERGRELRHFIETGLGPEGMMRSVVVAATSDQSPLARRRCAWTAMAVAEYFRDAGKQVLLMFDSITRFAEAHREVAIAADELPTMRGFPASTSHMIMSLCERAGPGAQGCGDITALFSVLVAGSDLDEPVADILRGVLDGHVVLDRQIAERGRYPAIDLLQSVSRSLPQAANEAENQMILRARALLGAYARSETMVRAGLYSEGSDPDLDQAIRAWPELDAFLSETEPVSAQNSFDRLNLILRRSGQARIGSGVMGRAVGHGSNPGTRAPIAPSADIGTG